METTVFVKDRAELIKPYGGSLVDLTVPADRLDELKSYASQLFSVQISPRSACNLELLATGAFSPLNSFMGEEDYTRVLDEMRLSSGHVFPIPVTLPVEASRDLHLDQEIALRNSENELLAILTVQEIYEWDRNELSCKVFDTFDSLHPVVAELSAWGPLHLSGKLQVLSLPSHYDFQAYRLAPAQVRAKLAELGKTNVIAYQPKNKLSWLDEEVIKRNLDNMDGVFLVQPAAGVTRLGDIDYYARVRFYLGLVEQQFKPDQAVFSLLPLVNYSAGQRGEILHALIQRNFGASHRFRSRDHSSLAVTPWDYSCSKSNGKQDRYEKCSQELGVQIIHAEERSVNVNQFIEELSLGTSPSNPVQAGYSHHRRRMPGWAYLLEETHLPRHRQGVCIWFTGLSGAGKSTLAKMLTWRLLEHGKRVTVLDGDDVRTHLSKGLGYSKDDRDTNVRRIGYVAAGLVQHGGVVISAVVSPYRDARNDVRRMVGEDQFVEVFVNTPLDVCEERDVKGLYARARRGELTGFTGIDDPYEPPYQPEITLDSVNTLPKENVDFIVDYLTDRGFILDS